MRVCVCLCVKFTRHGAAKDLQPHTQRAIPALGDDPDVAGQHRLCQLIHHWSVRITVSKEQLDKMKVSQRNIVETSHSPQGSGTNVGELTQSAYPSWMVVHSLLSLLKARKYDVTKSDLQGDNTQGNMLNLGTDEGVR